MDHVESSLFRIITNKSRDEAVDTFEIVAFQDSSVVGTKEFLTFFIDKCCKLFIVSHHSFDILLRKYSSNKF